MVARWSHKPKVLGSNPSLSTKFFEIHGQQMDIKTGKTRPQGGIPTKMCSSLWLEQRSVKLRVIGSNPITKTPHAVKS